MLPLSLGEAMLRPRPKHGFGRQRRKHGWRTPEIHLQRTDFVYESSFFCCSLTKSNHTTLGHRFVQ